MRVHELAKELGIESKELTNFLAGQGIEVKSANTATDEVVALSRKQFGKKSPSSDEKTDTPPKIEKSPAQPKEASVKRPKKKSTTYAVFNPQNSKNMGNKQAYYAKGNVTENRGQKAGRQVRPGERPLSRRLGERPVSKRLLESERQDREARLRAEKEREERAREEKAREALKLEKTEEVKPARTASPAPERKERQANPPQKSASERKSSPQTSSGRHGRPGAVSIVINNNNNTGGNNNNNNNRGRNGGKGNNQRRDNNDRVRKQENFFNLEKKSNRKKPQPQPQKKEDDDAIKSLTLPEHLTIKELSDRMKVQASMLIKKLFLKGKMVTVNQEVDYATAEEIALEFNFIAEPEEKVDVIAELLREEEEDESKLVARPPVVCVMGHVDHGKTSLLDAIRDSHVTDREAGGITQKIGAYVVSINGRRITFLDTPGHEAFTAMRMRGASSTDIAILVVAADDGVMPQTVEAINHAKAAGIEIIVAINKIDKPNANIDRVKQELSEYELIPEDWGGSTIFVPVSAHTHEGIDNLLEMVLLTADVLELKANPKRNARGVVIEAQLDKGRGAVATILVQKGTLKVGQPVACGSAYGKVRAMVDENGRRLKEAGPSTPVEILGLNNVPDAGETFVVLDSEKDAHSFAETYISQDKEKLLEETRSRMSLDDLFSRIQAGNVKELDIIVKADVQGSVEAVKQSLEKLSNDEVVVKVIHGGVGAISESDVILASASSAIIIGFNVRPDPQAKATAETEGVDIRLYKVIYNAIEDVEAAMKGMLDPVFEEKILGHAEIRQIFKASGIGNIAGSYVLDGTFERDCMCRITREGEQIFEGKLASLKRFKDDVKEVKAGYECGLVFENFGDIAELDQVEAYKMVEVER